jgi:hypothetical protein
MPTVKANGVMKRFAVSQCEEGKTLILVYLCASHLERGPIPGPRTRFSSISVHCWLVQADWNRTGVADYQITAPIKTERFIGTVQI